MIALSAGIVTLLLAVTLGVTWSVLQDSRDRSLPGFSLTTPTSQPAQYFVDPNRPIYEPESGFHPDARRVLDLYSLQVSLFDYRQAHGAFPRSLDELFPDFAPKDEDNRPLVQVPTDPATGELYRYEPQGDGNGYLLSAITSTGERFEVRNPETTD